MKTSTSFMIHKALCCLAICAAVAVNRLPAQSTLLPTSKWELGLKVYYLGGGSQSFVRNFFHNQSRSFGTIALAVANYRPSDKLFWRFGLGMNCSRQTQVATNLQVPHTGSYTKGCSGQLVSLIGIGHTFAPSSHEMLKRFRLSLGVGLQQRTTLYSIGQSVNFRLDSLGNETTFENNFYTTYNLRFYAHAFGLAEFRLSQRLHLGVELDWGIALSRNRRVLQTPSGPSESPDFHSWYLEPAGRVNQPNFSLTYSF